VIDAIESITDDPTPEQARRPHRLPRQALLGVGLVTTGMATSFTAFGAAWEAGVAGQRTPFWILPMFIWGLTMVTAGAGVIVWRAVVRFRRHGLVVAVLAGVGGLGVAFLVAVASFFGVALFTQFVTSFLVPP
jgi:cation transport ATPase